MPCFKGLAVSIHTPDGPISEYGIQKQTKHSRISSYIPVPPATVPPNSTTGKPEQSTFAISVTLLTPGLNVPYSTPKPTPDNPYPQPRIVGGGLPSVSEERGKYLPNILPYTPRTSNPNETVAAYIYFDGRAKEEVATLLRRGEETWVNSRWVSVPQSEGGGLAEREFLFREVGLERWLNGLDLDNSKVEDKARRVERRQRRLEKQRRKRGDMDMGDVTQHDALLRSDSDSDSDDEPPQPEAAGQIKVALFRVLASGEIKRGEYSPQFDAHDDDDDGTGNGANGDGADEDIDHTTSFAKPKTLDPKSISTQTVTGLDPPESPYATFTFFYRGEKQLRRMNILPSPTAEATPASARRKSTAPDFASLGPLKTIGTKGFSGYRDSAKVKGDKTASKADAMDSDAEDDDDDGMANGADDGDDKAVSNDLLSPDDARRQGEIADGVSNMKLKRQHSAEPLGDAASTRKSPHLKSEETPPAGTPHSVNSVAAEAGTPPAGTSPNLDDPASLIGSPYKRQRASIQGNLDSNLFSLDATEAGAASTAEPNGTAVSAGAAAGPEVKTEIKTEMKMDSDEELHTMRKRLRAGKLYGCARPPPVKNRHQRKK